METEKRKPKWKKIVVVAIAVVLLLVVGAIIWTETLWHCLIKDVFGDETTQVTDRVRVYLNWECREDFYSQSFTEKDFKYGNVKKIEYKAIPYDGNSGADYVEAFIVVYLKTPGEYQCKKAILRFEKLDFVVEAVFDDDTSSKERLLW